MRKINMLVWLHPLNWWRPLRIVHNSYATNRFAQTQNYKSVLNDIFFCRFEMFIIVCTCNVAIDSSANYLFLRTTNGYFDNLNKRRAYARVRARKCFVSDGDIRQKHTFRYFLIDIRFVFDVLLPFNRRIRFDQSEFTSNRNGTQKIRTSNSYNFFVVHQFNLNTSRCCCDHCRDFVSLPMQKRQ